jgi:hypothetical protein
MFMGVFVLEIVLCCVSVIIVLLRRRLIVDVDCWCYAVKRMVTVRGDVVGRRAAEVLNIVDCLEADCPRRGSVDCLVGKIREGRWR